MLELADRAAHGVRQGTQRGCDSLAQQRICLDILNGEANLALDEQRRRSSLGNDEDFVAGAAAGERPRFERLVEVAVEGAEGQARVQDKLRLGEAGGVAGRAACGVGSRCAGRRGGRCRGRRSCRGAGCGRGCVLGITPSGQQGERKDKRHEGGAGGHRSPWRAVGLRNELRWWAWPAGRCTDRPWPPLRRSGRDGYRRSARR